MESSAQLPTPLERLTRPGLGDRLAGLVAGRGRTTAFATPAGQLAMRVIDVLLERRLLAVLDRRGRRRRGAGGRHIRTARELEQQIYGRTTSCNGHDNLLPCGSGEEGRKSA